jgi:diguanylate cyclase (GGDEF)-like protein
VLSPDHADVYTTFAHQAEAWFGLSDADIVAVAADVDRDVVLMASLLSFELPEIVSYQTLLDAAREASIAIGLRSVIDLQVSEEHAAQLDEAAHTDALTGIPNRRAGVSFLEQQVALRRSAPRPEALGVLLMDIDHFKCINDRYGHATGDAVLRAVAKVARGVTRSGELFFRYGGEEFCWVLPQTSPNGLFHAAERLRGAIAGLELTEASGAIITVTASFGGACAVTMEDDSDGTLLRHADACLYRAKCSGRNRSEIRSAAG